MHGWKTAILVMFCSKFSIIETDRSGIPIVVIIKVIAEHIEGMSPIAELLGE